MQHLRTFFRARPLLAALILAAALLMRVAVPAGMMPVASHGTLSLALCDGHGAVAAAMSGMVHNSHDAPEHDGKTAPCDFAGLGLGHTGSADPVLLAIALVFAAAAAIFAYRPLPSRRTARLLPPLRGPPTAV